MSEAPDSSAMVYEFFRTFIDPTRMRVGGCLLNGPITVSELSRQTETDTRTLVQHLSRIEDLGLLETTGEGAGWQYAMDEGKLRALAAAVLQHAGPPGPPDERGKTLRTFFSGGKLAQMPVQQRKQLYILAEVAALFHPGATYYESEVNIILMAVSAEHYGTLRRMLVDYGFLKRDSMLGGAVYTKGLSVETVLDAHGIAGDVADTKPDQLR